MTLGSRALLTHKEQLFASFDPSEGAFGPKWGRLLSVRRHRGSIEDQQWQRWERSPKISHIQNILHTPPRATTKFLVSRITSYCCFFFYKWGRSRTVETRESLDISGLVPPCIFTSFPTLLVDWSSWLCCWSSVEGRPQLGCGDRTNWLKWEKI